MITAIITIAIKARPPAIALI